MAEPLYTAGECEERAEQALAQADEISKVELRMELLTEATAWATLAVAKRSGYIRSENVQGVTYRMEDVD